MRIFDFLGRLSLRYILRSAMTLEEEIYGLYEALNTELKGVELPERIRAIVEEEKAHQQLLRDIIAGRLTDGAMERVFSGTNIHKVEEVKPLPPKYAPILERLRHIRRREQLIYTLFQSLYRKATIRFVKRAFHFLAEQEEVHLQLLDRLLG